MKRIMTLLVFVIMLCQMVVFPMNAQVFAEEVTFDYAREERLLNLGAIYKSEDKALGDTVLRGEFTKILVKFLGKNDILAQRVTLKPYSDVALNYAYIREIKLLKDLKVFASGDRMRFRPEAAITVLEAADMIDAALGYGKYGNRTYSAKGDILKGINKSYSAPAVLDDIYALLDNSLHVEIFDKALYDMKIEHEKETVLERFYGYEQKRGVLTANSNTSLTTATDSVAKGYVTIEDATFKIADEKYSLFLGYTVDYYLDEESGVIIYMEPYKRNYMIEIDAQDVIDSSNTEISYLNEKEKEEKLKFNNIDVIYNEKAYSGFGLLESILPEDNATLKLLDRDDDEYFDVLFITEYKDYLVGQVDSDFGYIYEKNTNVKIDLTNNFDVKIYREDGQRITLQAVKSGEVISIKESKNKEGKVQKLVYVNSEPIVGTVKRISDDEILLDDQTYLCTDEVISKVSVGESGEFFMGKFGKLVKFVGINDADYKLGVACGFSEKGFAVRMKIFTQDGEFLEAAVSEKVWIDKTSAHGVLKGQDNAVSNIAQGEIIRYKLDTKGEVKTIQPADKGTMVDGKRTYANEKGLRLLTTATNPRHYNKMFDRLFGTDNDTQYFVVPNGTQSWAEEENFHAQPLTFDNDRNVNVNNTSVDYVCDAYIIGESMVPVADVFVIAGGSAVAVDVAADMFVFDEMKRILVDNAEMIQLLGVSGGKEVAYTCEEAVLSASGAQLGDILRVELKANGEVEALTPVLKYSSLADINKDYETPKAKPPASSVKTPYVQPGRFAYSPTTTTITGANWHIYAQVRSVGENGFVYDSKYDARDNFAFLSSCVFTRYNVKDGKVEAAPGTINDISAGDKILMVTNYGVPRQMIIFKYE